MGIAVPLSQLEGINPTNNSKMKFFVLCALFALAAAEPKAEADAQMFYNMYGYWPQSYMQGWQGYMNGNNWMQSYGMRPQYQQYSYGHGMFKREAEAEPKAEAEAKPEAEADAEPEAEAMFYGNWPQMYNSFWQQGYNNGPMSYGMNNMYMNNMYMHYPQGQYNMYMNYPQGQYMNYQYMNNHNGQFMNYQHGVQKREAEAEADPAYFYSNYYNNGYWPQNYMYNRYMNGWRSYNSFPYRYSWGYRY